MCWYERIIQKLIVKYILQHAGGAFKCGKNGYVTIINNDEYHQIAVNRG